jgi:hypothetical protein
MSPIWVTIVVFIGIENAQSHQLEGMDVDIFTANAKHLALKFVSNRLWLKRIPQLKFGKAAGACAQQHTNEQEIF